MSRYWQPAAAGPCLLPPRGKAGSEKQRPDGPVALLSTAGAPTGNAGVRAGPCRGSQRRHLVRLIAAYGVGCRRVRRWSALPYCSAPFFWVPCGCGGGPGGTRPGNSLRSPLMQAADACPPLRTRTRHAGRTWHARGRVRSTRRFEGSRRGGNRGDQVAATVLYAAVGFLVPLGWIAVCRCLARTPEFLTDARATVHPGAEVRRSLISVIVYPAAAVVVFVEPLTALAAFTALSLLSIMTVVRPSAATDAHRQAADWTRTVDRAARAPSRSPCL